MLMKGHTVGIQDVYERKKLCFYYVKFDNNVAIGHQKTYYSPNIFTISFATKQQQRQQQTYDIIKESIQSNLWSSTWLSADLKKYVFQISFLLENFGILYSVVICCLLFRKIFLSPSLSLVLSFSTDSWRTNIRDHISHLIQWMYSTLAYKTWCIYSVHFFLRSVENSRLPIDRNPPLSYT